MCDAPVVLNGAAGRFAGVTQVPTTIYVCFGYGFGAAGDPDRCAYLSDYTVTLTLTLTLILTRTQTLTLTLTRTRTLTSDSNYGHTQN